MIELRGKHPISPLNRPLHLDQMILAITQGKDLIDFVPHTEQNTNIEWQVNRNVSGPLSVVENRNNN